jgi:hypothetical protein
MVTEIESIAAREEKSDLVLIAGASRGIGKAFYEHYSSRDDVECVGISRSGIDGLVQCDLLDKDVIERTLNVFDWGKVKSLLYIHSVGFDKFEPDGKPEKGLDNGEGIDKEVYESNVETFFNIYSSLESKLKGSIPVTYCCIGAVADRYEVPYWQSFTRSKDCLREHLMKECNAERKAVFLNVGSTLDETGNKFGRVNADTTYWQNPDDLVAKSVPLIDNMKHIEKKYVEADFFEFNPNYTPDYFTNHEKLYETWQKDLGYEGREVPHGIRI